MTNAGGAGPAAGAGRRIRVMHVVDMLGLAGMEYGVIKLVNRLDTARFEPMICCLRFRADVTRPLLDPRIPVYELRKHEGRDLATVARLARLMRRQRVDVLHSHNWQTFFYARTAAALARVPVVVHGEHGRESRAVPRRRLILERYLATGVDYVVAVSADIASDLVSRWAVRPERVRAVPNGVDIDLFGRPYPLEALRRELGLGPAEQVVLCVGHFRPVKDHPTLLRAFARVVRGRPEARLVLVGDGWPIGSREGLEAIADGLGVRHAVVFAGTRHDVPQLLALCDAYVNTSLFEGMSNTILEAMAAGRPVVATAVGGNGEIVRDGATGYLVPAQDDRAIALRLEALLGNDAARARMGAEGRRLAERAHAISSMVAAYAGLYEEAFCRAEARRERPIRERAKGWAARGLRWSGIVRLREAAAGAGFVVLAYHRVLPLPEARRYYRQSMVMPRDLFEAQIGYIARRYAVLHLSEAVHLLQEGRLPRRAVAVTFDDGYGDNHEHAWPILRKYRVPATFFVVTGALDGTTPFWWDEVAEAVRVLAGGGAGAVAAPSGLPAWAAAVIETWCGSGRPEAAANALIDGLNRTEREERQRTLAVLREAAGNPGPAGSDAAMTWSQVAELKGAGMDIGSHTATHAFLDELGDAEVRSEVEGSLASLERRLGTTVRLLSYPRGRLRDELEPVLRTAGIEVAVTTEHGPNRAGADPLRLKRFDAGYGRSAGGFDAAAFDAMLQGLWRSARG